ncbi:MAG: DUF5666 domain-containing protein [Spartobacteria bacterium]
MKLKLPITAAFCLAALILGAPSSAPAKEKKTETATASESPMAKPRAIAYHGKVASIDASAKTFTIGKRTFVVTDKTQITKEGASATMADIAVGEKASGSYWKKDDGTLEAKSVKLGAKADATGKTTGAQKKETEATAAPKP